MTTDVALQPQPKYSLAPMSALNRILPLSVAVALLICASAHGQVFKCTDTDGGITYQQTPCPAVKSESVTIDAPRPESTGLDCTYASRFAVVTARLMRGGMRSDEVFDRYGGLDSMSRPTVGVINYVYQFRTNESVSIDRIAGLARAKCSVKSFGDARCESLPISFTDSIGGCDAGAESGERSEYVAALAEEPAQQATAASRQPPRPNLMAASALSEEATQSCKKHYRDSIDEIDAAMRRGYSSEQGEAYREKLRALTTKLREC